MSAELDAKKIIEQTFIRDDDLEVVRITAECLRKVEEGFYEKDFVNAVCQKHWTDYFNIYDAYVLLVINNRIKAGQLLFKKIYVGHTPYADKNIEENNNALKNLPEPFEAEFIPTTGAGAEDDGYFRVRDKVSLLKLDKGLEKEVNIDRLSVALEVGYTKSHTTFKHVIQNSGVARWPYDSKYIYLIYNPTPFMVGEKSKELIQKEPVKLEEIYVRQVLYRGKNDEESLIDLLKWVNEKASKFAMPINLYTHSSSPIDICCVDFSNFNLSNSNVYSNGMCIASVSTKFKKVSNNIVIRPNTCLTVSFNIDIATSGQYPDHEYLAISFIVEEL